jgi:hypothetical protein
VSYHGSGKSIGELLLDYLACLASADTDLSPQDHSRHRVASLIGGRSVLGTSHLSSIILPISLRLSLAIGVMTSPSEKSVIDISFRERPGSQSSCDLPGTAADLKGLGPSPIAVHHHCDRPQPGCPPSPLQALEPFPAFRLTPALTWSTDTSSNTPMSVAYVEAPARVQPSRSHRRTGRHTHALAQLRL